MSRKRKHKPIKVAPKVLEVRRELNAREHEKRVFKARPGGQQEYVRAIVESDVTICTGMAGTGKTHVAIGMALQYYDRGLVDRIIIARPAIEAGDTLGFLPGNLDKKLDPFMRPIFDELHYFRSFSDIAEMRNTGILEVCSIGHLRGRTLKNSFIFLDEAQNASYKQMEMFLTRFGTDAKVVVAGHPTQTDLDYRDAGALDFACAILETDPDFRVVRLEAADMVRHPLIVKIDNLWNKHVDIFKMTGKLKE